MHIPYVHDALEHVTHESSSPFVSVDPCFAGPCLNGGTCTLEPTDGSFTCACVAGFGGPTCDGKLLYHFYDQFLQGYEPMTKSLSWRDKSTQPEWTIVEQLEFVEKNNVYAKLA